MSGSRQPDRVAVYREAVGRLLMGRRKRQGLTIGQLGKAAGMSRAAVGRIEAGDASPNVEQLRRLAGALQATPAVVYGELDRAIAYLEGRGTLIVEVMPGDGSAQGRLEPPPADVPWPLLRVSGPTLMREIEAGLGLRPAPPRTPADAFAAQCDALGLVRPRTRAELERAQRSIAVAILDGALDEGLLPAFGPPDPLAEDSALLEFIDLDDLEPGEAPDPESNR